MASQTNGDTWALPTVIQNLIHGAGCDGLQLASYARLSLDAAGVYMRAFGAPASWPADIAR